jgi:sarcosine oxidase
MVAAANFDVLVIGRGLLAAAGARHLARENLKVALLGPTEEQCLKSGRVFASHFDNTRVQRTLAHDELWTRLNRDSVKSWEELQEATGSSFYRETGCIYLNTHTDGYLAGALSLAKTFNLTFETIENNSVMKAISPYLQISESVTGLFEVNSAGWINPRKLVSAQLQSFIAMGGIEVNEYAVDVSRSGTSWLVRTSLGQELLAKQVLVAAGSFTNYFRLLPRKLDFQNKSEVVIMAKITEEDYLRMKDMPSLLFEKEEEDFDGIYLTAPTEAEDGSYILKMGLKQRIDRNLNEQSAMEDWFAIGDYRDFAPVLERELRKIFPTTNFVKTYLKPCVISRTVTENPYIGEVDSGLFVLLGCNGYSAMSSDAQGRQAGALIANGRFEDGYKDSDFQIVYK